MFLKLLINKLERETVVSEDKYSWLLCIYKKQIKKLLVQYYIRGSSIVITPVSIRCYLSARARAKLIFWVVNSTEINLNFDCIILTRYDFVYGLSKIGCSKLTNFECWIIIRTCLHLCYLIETIMRWFYIYEIINLDIITWRR